MAVCRHTYVFQSRHANLTFTRLASRLWSDSLRRLADRSAFLVEHDGEGTLSSVLCPSETFGAKAWPRGGFVTVTGSAWDLAVRVCLLRLESILGPDAVVIDLEGPSDEAVALHATLFGDDDDGDGDGDGDTVVVEEAEPDLPPPPPPRASYPRAARLRRSG